MDPIRFAKKIGLVVTEKRKAKGLSREALGALSGTSPVTVQRLEAGTSAGIGLDTLLGIAEPLDISIAQLLMEEENLERLKKNISSQWHDILCKIQQCPSSKQEWLERVITEVLSGLESPTRM